MRLKNLHLVRFGKFTDTDISLPKAEHDFHLVIGHNEAGKSTMRGAIADLLFGFPARYPAMAFIHHQADLRLAATVSEGDEHLSFIRTKGNKNTLRTAEDVALPDNALLPFMGQTDRGFFETMFGLSHTQLVTGGDAILDASKDVSQVLFQSAAGIAGLGKVKDVVSCDGRDASRLMVEHGMAWAYRTYLKRPELLQLEASAKSSSAGLWAAPAVPPWVYRRAAKAAALQASAVPSAPASGSATADAGQSSATVHTSPRGGKYIVNAAGHKEYLISRHH
jgi:AAA domain/Staphylococcal nuclease homologue